MEGKVNKKKKIDPPCVWKRPSRKEIRMRTNLKKYIKRLQYSKSFLLSQYVYVAEKKLQMQVKEDYMPEYCFAVGQAYWLGVLEKIYEQIYVQNQEWQILIYYLVKRETGI